MGLGEVFEVNVDIRHGDTVRVQETLEQELVPDRVQIRNLQAVGDHRSCRGTTPGAHHGAHRTGCGNVVLDDEEVVREAHSADGLELEVYAFCLLVRECFPVALVRSLEGEVAEVCHGVAEAVSAVGSVLVAAAGVDDVLVFLKIGVDVLHELRIYLENRKNGLPVDGVAFYLGGHLKGVFEGFWMAGEQRRHLLFRLDIFLLGVAEAVRVVDVGVRGEADEAVMHGAVLLADKVGVVGCDDLDAVLFCQLENAVCVVALLFIELVIKAGDLCPVLHHLKVVVLSEDLLVPGDGLVDGRVVMRENGSRHLSGNTCRAADEPFVVFFYDLMAHARPVVHAVHVAF